MTDRGQAEIVGSVATLAMVVLTTATVGFAVAGSVASDARADAPLATYDLRGLPDGGVEVIHTGGDPVPLTDLTVVVVGPDGRERVDPTAGSLSGADDTFDPGERWRYDGAPLPPEAPGTYRVLVVHDPTGGVVDAASALLPDAVAPTVEAFDASAANGTVSVTVASDEPLAELSVQVAGPDDTVTLSRSDFTRSTDDDGTPVYEATLTRANGEYDVTLASVTDEAGTERSVEETVSVTVEDGEDGDESGEDGENGDESEDGEDSDESGEDGEDGDESEDGEDDDADDEDQEGREDDEEDEEDEDAADDADDEEDDDSGPPDRGNGRGPPGAR